MPEAVRLVVWDLDETFWRGTVTEGGIREYVKEHHEIVVELAKRGILSSICSKNDASTILPILEENGILEYFIFPDISWEPKGPRLARLIEQIQLRPATVMFIDDNPGNRAEAASIVADLQVEDETFIPQILSDPRFKGKDDAGLTRLAQYKLLESKKRDEESAGGNNHAFLRSCDIRVCIEYDVVQHADRAIELINRTNQLNFTKVRYPEDIEEARKRLRLEAADHSRQCGLVRVVDKYGDYGFVGFFMLKNGAFDNAKGQISQILEHYCFSCRTLGMLVESWLYDYLQRPRLRIVGEVLTDLTKSAPIDWIRLVPAISADGPGLEKLAPEIRIHGGCEAQSIAHYLVPYADSLTVTGNFHAGTNFVRYNSATLLLSASDRNSPAFGDEAKALGLPAGLMTNRYFDAAPDGTVFIFGGQLDIQRSRRYRHRVHGWEMLVQPHGLDGVHVTEVSPEALRQKVESLPFSDAAKSSVLATALHLQANYATVQFDIARDLPAAMHRLFDKIPVGGRLILILDHDFLRTDDQRIVPAPWARQHADCVMALAADFPFVTTISFSDHILSDDEIRVGGNHYDRMVYFRMAQAIVAAARKLPAKTAAVPRFALSAAS